MAFEAIATATIYSTAPSDNDRNSYLWARWAARRWSTGSASANRQAPWSSPAKCRMGMGALATIGTGRRLASFTRAYDRPIACCDIQAMPRSRTLYRRWPAWPAVRWSRDAIAPRTSTAATASDADGGERAWTSTRTIAEDQDAPTCCAKARSSLFLHCAAHRPTCSCNAPPHGGQGPAGMNEAADRRDHPQVRQQQPCKAFNPSTGPDFAMSCCGETSGGVLAAEHAPACCSARPFDSPTWWREDFPRRRARTGRAQRPWPAAELPPPQHHLRRRRAGSTTRQRAAAQRCTTTPINSAPTPTATPSQGWCALTPSSSVVSTTSWISGIGAQRYDQPRVAGVRHVADLMNPGALERAVKLLGQVDKEGKLWPPCTIHDLSPPCRRRPDACRPRLHRPSRESRRRR